jgi:hypothetical protein
MPNTETTPLINPTDGQSQGLKDFLDQLGIGM